MALSIHEAIKEIKYKLFFTWPLKPVNLNNTFLHLNPYRFLGKPPQKISALIDRAIKALSPSSLMAVEFETLEKRFQKVIFSLMARPLREEIFLRLSLV